MKPVYALVNKDERDRFEKENQLPYGYGGCAVYLDPLDAIEHCKRLRKVMSDQYIVEYYEGGERKELPI